MKYLTALSIPILVLALLLPVSSALFAEEEGAEPPAVVIDVEKTPWLKDVDIPPIPPNISPVIPATIYGPDGGDVPATLSEDIGVLFTVESDVFAEKPPTEFKGEQLPNGVWDGQPSIRWYFADVKKHKSTFASCSEILPKNQMRIKPLDPCELGGVTIFLARPMKYEVAPGEFRRTYVNSSIAANLAVTDITPPTCGLDLKGATRSGSFWSLENPPNSEPPKNADAVIRGNFLAPEATQEMEVVVQGLDLAHMVVPESEATIYLPKDEEVTVGLLLQDNYQIDEKSVRFGISETADEEPIPVGALNPEKIKLSDLQMPEKAFLFIEAKDRAGNRQIYYVPVKGF